MAPRTNVTKIKPAGKARAAKPPAPQRPAGIGDNSGSPTAAERKESTYRVCMDKVKRTKKAVEAQNAILAELKKEFNTATTEFKNATSISKANLKLILAKLDNDGPRSDLVKEAVDFHWMAEMEGIPVGSQMSLITAFEKTPDAKKEEIDWEGEGWRAYARGYLGTPPATVPTMFHQAWMKGWHDHQERTIIAMKMAENAKTEAAAAPPEKEAEPADEFEASPAELKKQIDRQVVEAKKSLESLGAGEPEEEGEDEAEAEPVG